VRGVDAFPVGSPNRLQPPCDDWVWLAAGLVAPWLKPGPETRGWNVLWLPPTVDCRELKKR